MRNHTAVELFIILLGVSFLISVEAEKSQAAKPADITTEFMCIELSKAELEKIEKTIGFSLDPLDGKILLSGDERKKLLAAIRESESAEILGTRSITSLPMCQCGLKKEESERIKYPARYRIDSSKGDSAYVPDEYVEREIGFCGSYTPTEAGENAIDLRLSIEMVKFIGWNKISESITQPVLKSWGLISSIILPDGMTYVLKNIAPIPFAQSSVLPKESDNNANEIKCCLFLIAAKKNTH